MPLADLRLLNVGYRDPDGSVRQGAMVVHTDVAEAVIRAFKTIFEAAYPITRMRLMDEYDGDDLASMNDDNTSAFNCRPVKGTSRWSQHSYGRALDINPFENPWVRDGEVDPPAAAAFADRSKDDPRVIRHGDAVWSAFEQVGWEWGGDWTSPKDYQHFSANGR